MNSMVWPSHSSTENGSACKELNSDGSGVQTRRIVKKRVVVEPARMLEQPVQLPDGGAGGDGYPPPLSPPMIPVKKAATVAPPPTTRALPSAYSHPFPFFS
jgi:hypothetical protein